MKRLLEGMRALVTGGTRGLGRALCEELAREGARVVATYRWDREAGLALVAHCEAQKWPAPVIVEADACDADDTRLAVECCRRELGGIDAVFSNVAFAQVANGVGSLKRRSLELSLAYSSWPLVDLLQSCKEVAGAYPRYVIAVSSDGPDVCHPGYDYVAACKSTLETLCRYLALALKGEGVRVNAIRPGFLDTESSRDTFGAETLQAIAGRHPDMFLDPRVVARAGLALCSGLMDSVTGQVLTVDEGWSLVSPIALLTGVGAPAPFPREER